MVVVAELDGELDDDPDEDGDQAGASDARHDLLQVGHVVGARDQRGGAPEERALACRWVRLGSGFEAWASERRLGLNSKIQKHRVGSGP